jgi:hypothetical protein
MAPPGIVSSSTMRSAEIGFEVVMILVASGLVIPGLTRSLQGKRMKRRDDHAG